jgi:N-methylhydantoinase B/oxoprolinase/acetone carboxylase alpha subunit
LRRISRSARRRGSRSRWAFASTVSTIPRSGCTVAGRAAPAAVTVNGKPVHAKKTISLVGGDVYAVRCAGGAGYGDPRERPPAAVLRDVRGGYVSTDVCPQRVPGRAQCGGRCNRTLKPHTSCARVADHPS